MSLDANSPEWVGTAGWEPHDRVGEALARLTPEQLAPHAKVLCELKQEVPEMP
jgi:hypothetical protein